MKIIITLFYLADAVKCYTCSTLGDPEVCKLWQGMEDNQKECVAGSRCLTISYKESYNGAQRSRFVKKCSNPTLNYCDSHCKNVKNVIPNTCRVRPSYTYQEFFLEDIPLHVFFISMAGFFASLIMISKIFEPLNMGMPYMLWRNMLRPTT